MNRDSILERIPRLLRIALALAGTYYIAAYLVLVIFRIRYPFELEWFDPFLEFRFPHFGSVNIDAMELELRFAIEPWHVLGEEMGSQGTARFVDSSVERLQLRINGLTELRHVVVCNGRRLALRSTGMRIRSRKERDSSISSSDCGISRSPYCARRSCSGSRLLSSRNPM